MTDLCAGVEGPDGTRPIYYDEIARVRFERHDETRYDVVVVTDDGYQALVARHIGHWLAEHLIDGLVANSVPVWIWDAEGMQDGAGDAVQVDSAGEHPADDAG